MKIIVLCQPNKLAEAECHITAHTELSHAMLDALFARSKQVLFSVFRAYHSSAELQTIEYLNSLLVMNTASIFPCLLLSKKSHRQDLLSAMLFSSAFGHEQHVKTHPSIYACLQ